jgi:C-terminal processing protease CtpA/Prc
LILCLLSIVISASFVQTPSNFFEQVRIADAEPHQNWSPAHIAPEDIYYQAWEIVNQNYYDRTFGDQNWSHWKHRYDGKLKTRTDAHKAIETMLASLGNSANCWILMDQARECTGYAPSIYGTGAHLGIDRQHRLVIMGTIPNSPASLAGLKSGDVVVEIDGRWARGFSTSEAAEKLRADTNKPVVLKVLRNGIFRTYTVPRAHFSFSDANG